MTYSMPCLCQLCGEDPAVEWMHPHDNPVMTWEFEPYPICSACAADERQYTPPVTRCEPAWDITAEPEVGRWLGGLGKKIRL